LPTVAKEGTVSKADGLVVDKEADEPIVARSEAMRKVCELVAKIAPSMAAVLIRGEPGVGKAAVAQAIHRKSQRAGGPFLHVNCRAIREADFPEGLFCDCRQGRPSLVPQAQGGTVLLSQVDHLPLWAQLQLLDLLKNGCAHCRLGPRPASMAARVIASTSCDLEAAFAEGRFSSGLYYYLRVITVDVPPLRQRPEDFDLLAQRCLEQTVARQGVDREQDWSFTPEGRQRLRSYGWPGNLPELASVVARAVALADGPPIGKDTIDFSPPKVLAGHHGALPVSLAGNLRQIERTIVEEVIERSGGNKAAAARILGLHRRTLYRILKDD
jgi:DNA-binding NtrC family response regulator